MNLMIFFLLAGSGLAILAGHLMILVAAFRQSLLWGVTVLLVPFVQLFFLIRHWNKAKKGFYTAFAGALVMMGAVFLLSSHGRSLGDEWEQAFASPARHPGGIEALTRQIQTQRDGISQLETEITQTSATLVAQYRDITAKRQALQSGDPAAVTKFNEEAAAYHQLNGRVKQMAQSLETAKRELGELLDQRSKLQAAAPRPAGSSSSAKSVVIYTSTHCGYCVKAKEYLGKKGIAYQEFNIENSQSAQAEFRRLGGNGVPLILIGDKRIEGFDQEAIDQALQ